jgi:PPOX class probable F420-dependent enzyme
MSLSGQELRIDEGTELGARAARHLREDPVVWLTTVGDSGVPTPNPVWFVWDGASTVLVYSLPRADRVRHLQARPTVSLNFAGDGQGGDIVVLTGTAVPRPDDPAADQSADYVAKYREHIPRIGLTPQTFAERYSLPVRITLTRLRGH